MKGEGPKPEEKVWTAREVRFTILELSERMRAAWRRVKDSEPDKDYYSILGAGAEATREEIERRYKRLAQRHHPDRGGDEEEMKSLNEAGRVLGNEESRRAYDSKRAGPRQVYRAHRPVSSPAAQADPLSGRLVGAMLCIFVGLVLLFLVRAHYVVFLWPLALLASGIVGFGVLM